MPVADDLEDVVQLRAALLDRDRRLVRLRGELVAVERWCAQLESQVAELADAVDGARASVEFALSKVPDLLEPEVDELANAVRYDETATTPRKET